MMQPFYRLLFVAFLLFSSPGIFAQKKITLEDIWEKGVFNQKSLRGVRSMNDGVHYTTLEKNDGAQEISQYSYSSGKKTATLLTTANLIPKGADSSLKIDDYAFSPDEKQILLSTGSEPIYRYSTREKNFIYDLSSKELTPVAGGDTIRLATFSPDGKKIAYVKDNNLYYTDLKNKQDVQITTDGKKNEIINGASDWVYEEELELVKGFEWSPDGERIAYYRFDEREVKEFSMPVYDQLYPTEYRFKYPKAGERNSLVSLHIYDLSTKNTVNVSLNDTEYIPRIQWTKVPSSLAIMTLNRHQDQLGIFITDAKTGKSAKLFEEKSDAYIEIGDYLTFIDESSFLWLSERSRHNQLYLYSAASGDLKQLTKGPQEVTEFLGYDEERKRIYYMQADQEDPLNRYLYAYDMPTGKITKLTEKEGFHEIKFSEGFRYYFDYHSTANQPLRITLHDAIDNKEIRVIEENTELKQKTEAYGFTPLTFFTFKNRNGEDLNGWMIKPPDFDPSEKYPVLMYVYGGPGSQTVKNAWGGANMAWYQMLAQKGYIVASVDNRGTGARGFKFRVATYKQLGKLETEDQIDAAIYLGQQNYVDSTRIGIWGWSYGGYMTTLCMTKGADHFKMGIAVAPVTNWRFYDSIYTERYMQTPGENPGGYDDNSPINHIDKLKGAYLLVHGTADDNVHFQNTAELIKALIEEGKQFELAIYPDKNHSIGGRSTRLHLYRKMTDFIDNNL